MPHRSAAPPQEVPESSAAESDAVKSENNGPPQVKERWLVSWRDGSVHLAEVVDISKGDDSKVGSAAGSSSSSSSSSSDETDGRSAGPTFYVHYVDFDRRLDEWVGLDRFNLEAGQQQRMQVGTHNGDKRRVTTRMKRKYDEIGSKSGHGGGGDKEGMDPTIALLEKEHEEITKVKNVQRVLIGKYEVETWYFSPYPDDYSKLDKLYVCEFCLKYMRKEATLRRHRGKCPLRFPPWRHCFHWMAGMLESADMRKLYDGLRKGLNGLRMKSMQSLPDFGSAHAIMCNCSHFRCQATHRALAECARRDPYGAFQVPAECRRWGAGATAAAAAASTARAAPEATAWAEKIKEAVDKAARRASPSTNSGATESTTNSTTAAANPPSSDARRGTTNPTNKTKPLSATSASPTKQAQQQQESSASQGTRPATATQAATATSGAKTNWRRGIAAEAGPLQEMGVGVGEEGRATVAGDMQRPIVSESGGGGVPHVGHVEEGCWCEKRGLGTRTPPKGLDSTQCSFDALALSRQSSLSLSGLDEGISPLMDGATFAFPALSNIFWGSSSRAVYGGGSPAVMDLNNINSNSSRGIESRRTGVRTASSSIGGAGEGGPDGGTSSAGGDTMMTAVSVVESVYTGDVLLGDRLAPVVNSVNKNQPWQQRVVANAVMSSSSNDSAPSQNSSNHRGLVMPQRGTSNGCLLPTSTAEKPLRPQLPTTGSGYASTTPTVYSGIDGGSVGGKGTGELVGGVAPSAGVEQQNALENSALWAVLCDTELGGGDEDMEMSDLGCQSSEALDVFAEDLESILSDCK